jgi:8-amino-7-oxononanoate synthase
MTWKDRIDRLTRGRREQDLWRTRTNADSAQARTIFVDGRELLNFCGNDYLGLANHPELAAAAITAIKEWGCGSGASHLVCGHSQIHERLEKELADFVGAQRSLLFSTGYMANLAVPQTFLDRHGLLIEDKLNHASLLDAGQLCLAKLKRYPHLDFAAADKLLGESNAKQKMLMTDGVFSMDGDVAPVVELNRICKQHDALLVLDDAHGLGVLGVDGGGCLQAHHIPVTGNVLLVGTLGKAAGSFGAFVAGDADLIESLVQFARPYIYTTALPPVVAATSLAAIEIIKREPQRRTRLTENIEYFRSSVAARGLQPKNSLTAIQPIIVGDSKVALNLSRRLKESGLWAAAIRPPTVPTGSARLRITLTCEHSHADIDRLVQCL